MLSFLRKYIFVLIDCLVAPFSILFLPLLKRIRRFGVPNFPVHKWLFNKIGVFPLVDHYYEPQFVFSQGYNASRKRKLLIDFREDEQLASLTVMNYREELNDLTINACEDDFYVNNPAFSTADADLYYLLIRNKKPSRIVEIGSGFSTRLALKAIRKNKEEGIVTKLTCIEPYEMEWLDRQAGIELIRKKLEEVPQDIFTGLGEGDILFIDSSHIIRPGNDVLVEYLEILPLLQKGVLVHIHDIFSPRDYPKKWITEEYRFWNEQYLLEAFLYFNHSFRVMFSVNHLSHDFFEVASRTLIHMTTDAEPGSFWIEKMEKDNISATGHVGTDSLHVENRKMVKF